MQGLVLCELKSDFMQLNYDNEKFRIHYVFIVRLQMAWDFVSFDDG